jgi:type IV pilus assembly protein PilW
MSSVSRETANGMPMPASRRISTAMKGFTLVELMVSMVIGLIILAAVAQIFATSRGTYNLEEGMARVQESGRFAMEFLSQDIRMAGYAGCNSTGLSVGTVSGAGANTVCSTNFCNGVSPTSAAFDFNPDGIAGHKYIDGRTTNNLNDWTPTLPSAYFADGQVKAGTDVIIIQRGSTVNTNITGNPTPDNANIQIFDTTELAGVITANSVLMITDCKAGDVFRANSISSSSPKKTISHTSGNVSSHLSHKYGNDAELMLLISRAYFIGTGASGEPALMMRELSTTTGAVEPARELVEGIEELRILYGEDTDATADNIANRYRTADAVTSWRRVINVRVGLLAVTPVNVDAAPDNKPYTLVPGQTLAAKNDKRRRQMFTSTVQVRNRFN